MKKIERSKPASVIDWAEAFWAVVPIRGRVIARVKDGRISFMQSTAGGKEYWFSHIGSGQPAGRTTALSWYAFTDANNDGAEYLLFDSTAEAHQWLRDNPKVSL